MSNEHDGASADEADDHLEDGDDPREGEDDLVEAPSTQALERPGLFGMLWLLFVLTMVRVMQALVRRLPKGRVRFFDTADFPWVREIEAGVDDIREELAPFLGEVQAIPNFQQVQPEERRLTQDDRWKVLVLIGYGIEHPPNVARFPRTIALLRKIPGVTTAMFSILREKKHLPPHQGPYSGVLRYHLAVTVPGDPEKSRIRVDNETRSWEEGKSLVFDDTFEHEVWKETDGARVVLFVDFLRPMPAPLAALNRWLVRAIAELPFVQRAHGNLALWEGDHGDALDALSGATRPR